MTVQSVLAQLTVTDLDVALAWYTTLFDRSPDARPMEGLAEWHLGPGYGVQVWAEPARAGSSAVVLSEPDLDIRVEHLRESGWSVGEPTAGGGSRLLQLADPDGNRVVLLEATPASASTIVVSGYLLVRDRDRYLETCRPVVEAARSAPGCLDFALSADLLDPSRINVLERWETRDSVEAFRGDGVAAEQAEMIVSAHVVESEVGTVANPT